MAQFTVKSENHTLSMLPLMENLKTVGCFVDVSLVCEGRTIKAHKLVLAAGSPFFRQLFLDNPCQHPVIILQDIKYSILKEIIDFLYKGELVMLTADLQTFLKTVKTLDVKNLVDICNEQFLQSHIANGSETNSADEETKQPPKKKKKKVVTKQKLADTVDEALESAGNCLSPNSTEKPEFCSPVIVETVSHQHDSPSDLLSPTPAVEEVYSFEQLTEDNEAVKVIENDLNEATDGSDQITKTTSDPQILFLSDKTIIHTTEKMKPIKSILQPTKRKTSDVWKFFKKLDRKHAKCNTCQKNFSYSSTVTNLVGHLRRKHNYSS